jgi:hypothetical protein
MSVHSSHHQNRFARTAGVVIVVAICLALPPITHTNAWRMATSHQPETFTELYFADPDHLPRVMAPGQIFTPDFIIRNLEGRTMTYQYELRVSSDTPGTQPTIASDTTTIGTGNAETVTLPVTMPSFSDRANLTISIKPTNQQIHYRVGRTENGATN